MQHARIEEDSGIRDGSFNMLKVVPFVEKCLASFAFGKRMGIIEKGVAVGVLIVAVRFRPKTRGQPVGVSPE